MTIWKRWIFNFGAAEWVFVQFDPLKKLKIFLCVKMNLYKFLKKRKKVERRNIGTEREGDDRWGYWMGTRGTVRRGRSSLGIGKVSFRILRLRFVSLGVPDGHGAAALLFPAEEGINPTHRWIRRNSWGQATVSAELMGSLQSQEFQSMRVKWGFTKGKEPSSLKCHAHGLISKRRL